MVFSWSQLFCAGAKAEDLVAWAKRVEQPNQWLEFADVLLFSCKKGFPLRVMVWHEGSNPGYGGLM